MQRTYDVPAVRAGLVALVSTLLLFALPGTSIAGGASQSTRSASEANAGLLQLGAGFAAAAGLAADGIVGPVTRKALNRAASGRLTRGVGYAQPAGSQRVKWLQRRLRRRGLNPGPIDGRYGPRTEAAVVRLQRRQELPAKGVVDPRTLRALVAAPGRQGSGGSADRAAPGRQGSGGS